MSAFFSGETPFYSSLASITLPDDLTPISSEYFAPRLWTGCKPVLRLLWFAGVSILLPERSNDTLIRGAAAGDLSRVGVVLIKNRPNELRQRGFPPILDRPVSCAGRWEALAESDQQIRWTLQTNPPSDQRPHETPFTAEKAQPRLAVGCHPQVRVADVSLLEHNLLVGNRDRCFALLRAVKVKWYVASSPSA